MRNNLKYYATQAMSVADPDTHATREVQPGDEVPEAAKWRNIGAYLSQGQIVVAPADADPADVDMHPTPTPVAEIPGDGPDVQEVAVPDPEPEPEVEPEVEPEDEPDFSCSYCGKTYNSQGWLDNHVEDKHADEVE